MFKRRKRRGARCMSFFQGACFAYLIIALSLFASAAFFAHGDVKRGFYWFFAAALNITVTV
ncbi:MAG: hypothetical protein GXX82_16655 [Syntrophorhabdus sp.]|nr:hypothetical protein [Syntrophorhabdus sp.]